MVQKSEISTLAGIKEREREREKENVGEAHEQRE